MKQTNNGQIHAVAAVITLILSTILCFIPILAIGLLKLIPNVAWKAFCTRLVDKIVVLWCGCNNLYIDSMRNIDWHISGMDNLKRKDWYLLVANHQSWLDIVILQRIFNRKIPSIKFFIKDQLKWVPLLGFSWWAMGCPFMKRYSQEFLAKNPHKKGKDLKATRKALEVFKRNPATIMNFVEGTRFTVQKQQTQDSPYQHLLKPKAGGISFVISAMGSQIKQLLDITIVYPNDRPSLWDFLCRRMHTIKVHVRPIPIPSEFHDEQLLQSEQNQSAFRQWLNERWQEKDTIIQQLRAAD